MTTTVAILMVGAAMSALTAWSAPWPNRVRVSLAGLTAGLLAIAALLVTMDVFDGWSSSWTVVAAGGLLAVVGGGPVTLAVFSLVDRSDEATPVAAAGEVLRGGAWIGGLERAAVFVTVVSGWPEGLAIVLALKGVARYPELRDGDGVGRSVVAERFIIGTFTSVLWAVGCALVALAA